MKNQYRFVFAMVILFYQMLAVAETVKIVAEDDWAPYSAYNAIKSGPEGYAVDIVREAFKTQNIDVEFVVLPFSRCLDAVKTGAMVGCFDETMTQTNKDLYYWHPTPLFDEELSIFGLEETPVKPLELKDLEGKSVGYTIGYTYPPEFSQNHNIKKYGINSEKNLIPMLVAGRFDYILLDGLASIYKLNQVPQLKDKLHKVGTLSKWSYWVVFSKIHPDGKRMVDIFEKGLQALKNSGRYIKMQEQFMQRIKAGK